MANFGRPPHICTVQIMIRFCADLYAKVKAKKMKHEPANNLRRAVAELLHLIFGRLKLRESEDGQAINKMAGATPGKSPDQIVLQYFKTLGAEDLENLSAEYTTDCADTVVAGRRSAMRYFLNWAKSKGYTAVTGDQLRRRTANVEDFKGIPAQSIEQIAVLRRYFIRIDEQVRDEEITAQVGRLRCQIARHLIRAMLATKKNLHRKSVTVDELSTVIEKGLRGLTPQSAADLLLSMSDGCNLQMFDQKVYHVREFLDWLHTSEKLIAFARHELPNPRAKRQMLHPPGYVKPAPPPRKPKVVRPPKIKVKRVPKPKIVRVAKKKPQPTPKSKPKLVQAAPKKPVPIQKPKIAPTPVPVKAATPPPAKPEKPIAPPITRSEPVLPKPVSETPKPAPAAAKFQTPKKPVKIITPLPPLCVQWCREVYGEREKSWRDIADLLGRVFTLWLNELEARYIEDQEIDMVRILSDTSKTSTNRQLTAASRNLRKTLTYQLSYNRDDFRERCADLAEHDGLDGHHVTKLISEHGSWLRTKKYSGS